MLKRSMITLVVLGLFGFPASQAMAGHGYRGHQRQRVRQPVMVGHGYQRHGNHIDHVDTYLHGNHVDTVRHHGRPIYQSYHPTYRRTGQVHRRYYSGYSGYGRSSFGVGVRPGSSFGVGVRPGVSFYFGW